MEKHTEILFVPGFIKEEGFLPLKGGAAGLSAENLKKFIKGEVDAAPFVIVKKDGSTMNAWIEHGSGRVKKEYHPTASKADLLISCYPAFIQDEELRNKALFNTHTLRLGVRLKGDYLYVTTLSEGKVLEKDYDYVMNNVKKQQLA